MPATWGLALVSLLGTPAPPPAQDTTRLRQLLATEDARPRELSGLRPLLDALHSPDTLLIRLAVRGLGRQERADLMDSLAAILASGTPAIRAEAANAIGQSALRSRTPAARRLLEDRIALESNPYVLGVLLRTLGRLPLATPDERQQTEMLLIRASRAGTGTANPALLEGAAHGFHSLFRRTAENEPPSVDAVERLVELLAVSHPAIVRRLAMAALVASLRVDSGILLDALQDPDREVRRLALLATVNQAALPGRERVVRRGWRDPDPGVRYEALRAFARHLSPREGCAPLLAALDDQDLHLTLLAIDLLAGCGTTAAPRLAIMARGKLSETGWHAPAHALVSLANVAPVAADSLLSGFTAAAVWWARMYAARAAEVSRNLPVLTRLARDRHPNVREAAIDALQRRQGHGADSLYLAALDSPDYQLVRTAARALDSSSSRGVLPALLATLERITREKREASRDTRAALLAAIGSIGSAREVPALRRYLNDFDAEIAQQAAEQVTRWSGTSARAEPRPLPRGPIPSWGELAAWERATVVVVLQSGGRVVLRLRPYDAPTNVARLVRMTRSRWFPRLTFHRVVPNFVVQGGSPGANEYAGDGPFTRDELGLEVHARGSVGVSTRGRDTGDGQIFINLVDNFRLDHDYTIIADVIEGMDVVDGMLEGAVIERVDIRERPDAG